MSITAMKSALSVLTDTIDMVRDEYERAVELYGGYPSRAARINGLLTGLKEHEDAITALRTAIQEAEACKPVAGLLASYRKVSYGAPDSRDLENGWENLYLAPPPAQPTKPLTCVWTPMDDDYMPGSWDSACGEAWSFIDGGVAENRVRFCHRCGKPVEIKEQP